MTGTDLDRAGVRKKFDVTPEQFVDFLALTGDKSDNIPGVEKCGPKTAVKWLKEWGSLDEVMAHADEIGGKIGENLRAALEPAAAVAGVGDDSPRPGPGLQPC